MKKVFAIILMLVYLTSSSAILVSAQTQDRLIDKLEKQINESILAVFYDDFDSNGEMELFAIVGEPYDGDVWFVSKDVVKKLPSGHFNALSGSYEAGIIQQNNLKYFYYCQIAGNGGATTNLCSVKNSEISVTTLGGWIKKTDLGLTVTRTDYDLSYDKTMDMTIGRTWKDYWFYFDDTGIHEYGAINISKEQFCMFEGSQYILSNIEGNIESILYRANGIININVSINSNYFIDYHNYLIGYDDRAVWFIDNQHSDASEDYRSIIYDGKYDKSISAVSVLPTFKYPEINGEETSFGSEVSEWAKEEVEEAYDENLVPEVLVGKDLTQKVDRAEFAAIAVALYENLTGSKAAKSNNPFSDIYGNACEDDILKAYNLDITTGTSATTFDPNINITREQMATMLTRAYKKSEFKDWTIAKDADYPLNFMGVKKFADDNEISGYAKESVYFMARWDIIKGVGDNKFAPKNNATLGESYGYATREQAVIIALRSVKHL